MHGLCVVVMVVVVVVGSRGVCVWFSGRILVKGCGVLYEMMCSLCISVHLLFCVSDHTLIC